MVSKLPRSARLRRGAIAGAVAGALAASILSSRPAEAAPPQGFYGVSVQSHELSDAEVKRLRRGGAATVRTVLPWGPLEPAPGGYDWERLDRHLDRLNDARARVIPVLYGSPGWLADPGSPVGTAEDEQAWRRFLRAVVGRYGPGGTRSLEDPRFAPIVTWQIWNEPNLPQFWDGEPNAAEYERLVAISAEEIRAVDPAAELILAPLSPAPKGVRPARFLSDVYRAARQRGGGAGFDQISLNPYGASIKEVRRNVERVVAVARREVGSAPPMLIAEIAWGSAGPKKSFLSGTRQSQARKLKRAYRMFRRHRREWSLTSVLWFAFRDRPRELTRCVFCPFVGLLDKRSRPKPAWQQFRRIATR